MFDISVEFTDISLSLPRDDDQWLMRMFKHAGFSKDDLCILNRVRIYQQVVFLSDVLGASGKVLDRRYLERRPVDVRWSKLVFPRERPTGPQFRLWRQALQAIIPQDGIPDRLGDPLHAGYKL